jgi:LysM repeat protein
MSRDRSAAVWLGVALGIGVLFLALVQVRSWVFDLQGRVEQIAQDNKLYLCKLEGALASLQKSNQKAQAESSPSDKAAPRNGPAVTEEPVHQKVPTPPKAPPVTTKASTEPLRTYKVCYRIKGGENLSEISERFRVSVDQLRHWNGLKPKDTVIAGHALDIYTTTTTDRLDYAASARVRETEIGESVTATQISTQEEPVSTGEKAYTVQPGENLHRIGRIHGMSWKSIANENGIENPNAIYAGQTLKIPAR